MGVGVGVAVGKLTSSLPQLGTKVENYVKNLIKTYGESKTRGDGHDSWDYIQEQVRP